MTAKEREELIRKLEKDMKAAADALNSNLQQNCATGLWNLSKYKRKKWETLMSKDVLHIKGAREHNLKDIEISIPRDKLIVVTGLSGSGKLPWLLTPYMLKGRGAMWSPCPLMPGSFWA